MKKKILKIIMISAVASLDQMVGLNASCNSQECTACYERAFQQNSNCLKPHGLNPSEEAINYCEGERNNNEAACANQNPGCRVEVISGYKTCVTK